MELLVSSVTLILYIKGLSNQRQLVIITKLIFALLFVIDFPRCDFTLSEITKIISTSYQVFTQFFKVNYNFSSTILEWYYFPKQYKHQDHIFMV